MCGAYHNPTKELVSIACNIPHNRRV